jgi:2-oxoglutarate dehydrogenase E1 component
VTQPLTYQKILNHPTALQIYSQKLLNEDIISQDIIDRWASEVETKFETEYVAADSCAPTLHEWLASNWQGTHNIWMTTSFVVTLFSSC